MKDYFCMVAASISALLNNVVTNIMARLVVKEEK